MSGRTRMGACGHIQQAIIGQFYLCPTACDGKRKCDRCGSDRVEEFVSEQVPPGSYHCIPCGKVMFRP